MEKTDFGSLLKEAFQLSTRKDNVVPLMLGALAVVVGSVGSAFLLSAPLILGYTAMLEAVARGQKADLGLMAVGFNRLGTALFAGLLMLIALIVGLACLVVPFFLLAFLFTYAFAVMADRPELSAVDAIGESIRLVKEHASETFVLWVISFVLCAVLTPLPLVGTVLGYLASQLCTILLYRRIAAPARGYNGEVVPSAL